MKLICTIMIMVIMITMVGCNKVDNNQLNNIEINKALLTAHFLVVDEVDKKSIEEVFSLGMKTTTEEMQNIEMPVGGVDLSVSIKDTATHDPVKWKFVSIGFSQYETENSLLYRYGNKEHLDKMSNIYEKAKKRERYELKDSINSEIYIANNYDPTFPVDDDAISEIKSILKGAKQISKQKYQKLTKKQSDVILDAILFNSETNDISNYSYLRGGFVLRYKIKGDDLHFEYDNKNNLYFQYKNKDDFEKLVRIYNKR